jgi:hypothetical protein
VRVRNAGVEADLPPGWEGRIRRGPPGRAAARAFGDASGSPEDLPIEEDLVTAHLGNFPLPADRGDFGSGAVDTMAAADAFVALLEYEPASARTALFERAGMPRHLVPGDFSPASLQRTLAGQAGTQIFFHEVDRAFCLYVVLGNAARAARTVTQVNRTLRTIRISRR